MQRWLTAYVGAFAMFLVVAFATLNTQFSFAAETDWDPHASSSTSTLAIQVAPQNFDLSASAFMMFRQHAQNAKAESLQLRPAQPTNPKIQTPKTQTPNTQFHITTESRSLTAQRSKPVPSPFTKWVAPQANRDKQVKVDSVESKPESFADAKPLLAPQLARRISPRESSAR